MPSFNSSCTVFVICSMPPLMGYCGVNEGLILGNITGSTFTSAKFAYTFLIFLYCKNSGKISFIWSMPNFCNYNFCNYRFADRFLSGTPEHDTLWNLVEHHVHHPRKYVDRNPFETMLHILASILSAYVTKGSHNHYQIYRAMIRHDPEGALRLLEGDWYCASPLENKFTAQSLQSFCLRRLLKPFIEDIIKEFAAYVHWYEMYKNYKIMTKQSLHFKFRRSFMLMTRGANMPLYPKIVQAEMSVNPRVAPPDSPESMNTD